MSADHKPKPKPQTTPPSQMEGQLVEFIQAIDEYKRKAERPFPTWSEVFQIVKELGYEQPEERRKAG